MATGQIPQVPSEKTISIRPVTISERTQEQRESSVRTLVGSVVVIAILYLAKPVFMPVALAILFTFLLRPIVQVLERTILRRTGAIILSIGVTVAILSLGAWSLSLQATVVAKEIAGAAPKIEKKLRALEKLGGGTIELIERTIQRVADSTQRIERADMKVRVIPERRSIAERYEEVAPKLEGVASSFLVVVLVFFLLRDREQMRDKVLRLAGRANFTVTTQAIGQATHGISRYLLTLSVINMIFGLLIGIGLVLVQLPHALLWAVIAGVSRFVPYVGAVLSAAVPTLYALAVFDEWSLALVVLGLFVLADQILGGFIEPLVIGSRVGVSPTALLVSAIFWGWLWGPVGLLLATPITVCLNVAGQFVPALRVFAILFGTESVLEGYLSFYNRLLVRDRAGAIALADRHAEGRSMEATFNELFIPTLSFAAEELSRNRITKVQDHFVKDVIRELIVSLGDRNATGSPPMPHIVAVPAAGERLSLGTTMLTQLMRVEGYAVDYLGDVTDAEVMDHLAEVAPEAVFVSCSNEEHLEHAMTLVGAIARGFPDTVVIAGGSAFAGSTTTVLRAGATFVPTSLSDGKEELMKQLKRVRRRPRTIPGTTRIPEVS